MQALDDVFERGAFWVKKILNRDWGIEQYKEDPIVQMEIVFRTKSDRTIRVVKGMDVKTVTYDLEREPLQPQGMAVTYEYFKRCREAFLDACVLHAKQD